MAELDELMAVADTRPVVNQVQFSPFEFRHRLLDACEQRRVSLEAYSPLGTGRHLSNERVSAIAERVGRTPAQVLLRWCVERDLVVLPKSTRRERIEENAQIFDFTLSADDIASLDALDETGGTDRARESKWWTPRPAPDAAVPAVARHVSGDAGTPLTGNVVRGNGILRNEPDLFWDGRASRRRRGRPQPAASTRRLRADPTG